MAYFGNVTITNKFGWSKTVEFQKALLTIGRSKTNDVVLEEEQGAGAEALHLQLVCPKTGDAAYRIINLSGQPLEIVDGPSAGTLIKSRTPQILHNGDVLVLGEFTLAFDLQTERGVCIERRSANLGMKLELPHAHLRPEKKLAGVLTLTNYGATRRCQFTIEVDGLPNDCLRVSPAPLLYPGASEEVEIQFFHRGTRPPAGRQPVRISACASQAYPQEIISLSLDLLVEAVRKYTLAFENEEVPQPVVIPSVQATAPAAAVPMPEEPVHRETEVEVESPIPAVMRTIPENQPLIAVEPETKPTQAAVSVPRYEPEPAPEPVGVLQGQETAVLQTPPVYQSVVDTPPEPQPIVEDDQDWWAAQTPTRTPQRQTEAPSSSRRNIRNMLAGKDIQVIKAGEEDLSEEAPVPGAQQNGSAE